MFCARVCDTDLFDEACVPGIRRVAEPDTVVVEADAGLPFGAAYDEVLAHFQSDDSVEAIVFVDEATELLASDTCSRLREALGDGDRILGAVGSRQPSDVRWWSGELVGGSEEPGGALSGSAPGLVDTLDGRLLVIPARHLDLRFGPESDPVVAVSAFCDKATAAGARLHAGTVPVRHHRVLDTTRTAPEPRAAVGPSVVDQLDALSPAPATDHMLVPSPAPATDQEPTSDAISLEEVAPSSVRSELVVTRSPQREDVVVARCLGPEGRYLDIGAGDPTISPTSGLATLGWRGLVVEPEVAWAAGHAAERGAESTVVATVVGQVWPAGAGLPRPPVSVDSLVDHLGGVDLLRIDNGGDEVAVLAAVDWTRVTPRVVIVTGARPVDDDEGYPRRVVRVDGPAIALLAEHGYVVGLFDGVNTFLVRAADTEVVGRIAAPANRFDGFVVA